MVNLRRKLLAISKIARQCKQLEEDRLKGFVSLPEWILLTDVSDKNYTVTGLEEVTIDMVNRLKGVDRVNMLKAFHDWKNRQKIVDKKFVEKQRIKLYKFQNPELRLWRNEWYFRTSKHNAKYIKFIKHTWKVLGMKIIPMKLITYNYGNPIPVQKSVQAWRNHSRERHNARNKLAREKKKVY